MIAAFRAGRHRMTSRLLLHFGLTLLLTAPLPSHDTTQYAPTEPSPALAAPTPARHPGDAIAQTPPLDTTTARVVILGTGTPNADPDRWGPAVAVVAGGRAYLVDAGAGVVRRAAAAARDHGMAALAPEGLHRLFITHLHSDHTVGLPDVILSPWVLDRPEPIRIFGPPGTAAMVAHIEEAWREDIHMRLFGLEPRDANRDAYRAPVTETTGGPVYDDDNVRVTAIPVLHGSWPHALGSVSRPAAARSSSRGTPAPANRWWRPAAAATFSFTRCTPRRRSSGVSRSGRPTMPALTPRPWSWPTSRPAPARSCSCCTTSSTGAPPTTTWSARSGKRGTGDAWFRRRIWMSIEVDGYLPAATSRRPTT